MTTIREVSGCDGGAYAVKTQPPTAPCGRGSDAPREKTHERRRYGCSTPPVRTISSLAGCRRLTGSRQLTRGRKSDSSMRSR